MAVVKWSDKLAKELIDLFYHLQLKGPHFTIKKNFEEGFCEIKEKIEVAARELKPVSDEGRKLIALMRGLEVENVGLFVDEADVKDYETLGKMIATRYKTATRAVNNIA